MKSILKCAAGVCLLAGLAHGDVVVFDYSSVANGTSVVPATGAATFDNFLVTSWVSGGRCGAIGMLLLGGAGRFRRSRP